MLDTGYWMRAREKAEDEDNEDCDLGRSAPRQPEQFGAMFRTASQGEGHSEVLPAPATLLAASAPGRAERFRLWDLYRWQRCQTPLHLLRSRS